MVLQHARRDARVDRRGRLVRLPEQDRARWRHDEIGRGRELLAHLGDRVLPGEYHLQALIAAAHTGPEGTDWTHVARLYAELDRRTGSPVVRLNRAVAVAESGAPEAALSLLAPLADTDHLVPAVRAEVLLKLGRTAEAAAAFDAALRLVRTGPEREHLRGRRNLLA